jgi:hypothetical protein
MNALEPLPVFICNPNGYFLGLIDGQWGFSPDPSSALIFDYHTDDLAAVLRQAQRDHGITWIAHPVDPKLAIEKCDECHCTILHHTDAHFDGSRFRCSSCTASPG